MRRERKIKHEFGSISYRFENPVYDIQKIESELGIDFLNEYGKVSSQKLEWLVTEGAITRKEILQFKKEVDIGLEFHVLPLDTEKKMYELNHKRTMRAAANRM